MYACNRPFGFVCAALTIALVLPTTALASDASPDGAADSGVSTTPVDSGASTVRVDSGDPAPVANKDDGGCAVAVTEPGAVLAWTPLALFLLSRSARRRKSPR